jgi:hypothetical protein
MSITALRAPPTSWNRIAAITDSLRRNLGLDEVKFFPVMEVLEVVLDQELGLVRIEVEEDSIMGKTEGFTDPGGKFIRFSETVYRKAYNGHPRARWTAAHETGHFFLHTDTLLTRVSGKAIKDMKPFECPERQAHQFAAELLMPRKFIGPNTSIKEVMNDFGVSEQAATKRKKFMDSLGG